MDEVGWRSTKCSRFSGSFRTLKCICIQLRDHLTGKDFRLNPAGGKMTRTNEGY